MTEKEEVLFAIDRLRNSDGAAMAHETIYGYSRERDEAVIGRYFLAQMPDNALEYGTLPELYWPRNTWPSL